jgi:hypothetical protein
MSKTTWKPDLQLETGLVETIEWKKQNLHTLNPILTMCECCILAGGKGTRLKPYTLSLPNLWFLSELCQYLKSLFANWQKMISGTLP